jgi:hypothetical protein
MNLEMVMVLASVLAAAVFLVLGERNSRRNEAKLKAESVRKSEGDPPSEKSSDANRQRTSKAESL